jgi:alkylated DNA repair dioxygenase AlkB
MDLFGGGGGREEPLPFKLPEAEGFDATWVEALKGHRVTVPDGEFFYAQRFFDQRISDRSVAYFLENDRFDWQTRRWRELSPPEFAEVAFTNIAWKQDFIRVYGKTHPLPRLTAWYGDSDRSYTYSGITSHPNPWNKGLAWLKEQVEACAGVPFNSVLLNWYRDGDDKLDWHADDERELGRDPVIASANFGATRDFLLRRNDDPSLKLSIPLGHGTLLIMRGALQHHWQHAVPKRAGVRDSRFNLTFRRIGLSP